MKRILVLTGAFYGHENAMSNAIYPLLSRLQKEYRVDIYTENPNLDLPLEEEVSGYHIYRNAEPYHGIHKKTALLLYKLHQIVNTDIRCISRKNAIIPIKILRVLVGGWTENSKKYILPEQLMNLHSYDAVISISSPIINQSIALDLYNKDIFKTRQCIWISYFLDPFATYIGNVNNSRFDEMMAFETDVYRYSDLIITSPEIKEDNHNYPTSLFDCKVKSIQLATLDFHRSYEYNPYPFPPSKINCFFAGSFFDIRVRNPKRMLEIISQIDESIQIYIACYLECTEVKKMRLHYCDGKNNIHWLGRVDIKRCFEMMKGADVLINVGNESSNQTPSKIFDYISFGKPIVNFYSISNDTSVKYTRDYPSILNLDNNEFDIAKQIKLTDEFIKQSKDIKIDIQQLEKEFNQYESGSIANEFANLIHDIMKQ